MTRDSFIFYKSFLETIDALPLDMQRNLYRAIAVYGITEEEMSLDGIEKAIWISFKAQLDANWIRFKNSLNGGAPKGSRNNPNGRPKANPKATDNKPKNNRKQTNNKPKSNQELTDNKPNVNDNVNVNVNDNDSTIVETKEKKKEKVSTCVDTQKKDKELSAADAALNKHREQFIDSLKPYVGLYGKEMMNDFFGYWSEPNKSHTKMRFELERTWDVALRLKTWDKNRKFNSNRNGNSNSTSNREAVSRLADFSASLLQGFAEQELHGDI